jgi:uncharacterized repeat protein (TIGR01451 family)
VGEQVTFTVTLTNRGPSTATNVDVRDVLPSGLTLVTATPSTGTTFAAGLWEIPTLSATSGSNTATLTLVATLTAGGTITNTAQVTASDQPDPDSTPNNNLATEDDQASATVTVGALADLELAKSVNDSTPNVGEQVTFTVTLTNRGPSTATNVDVRDVLPSGLTFVSATPSAGTTFASGLWEIPTLSATSGSNTANLSLVATVSAAGTITNTAQVTASDQPDPDSTPNNNVATEDDQASATVTVGALADLELAKSVSNSTPNVGEQVTFTVTLTNRGPSTATNVDVRDILPTGLTLVSATPSAGTTFATGLWELPTLPATSGSNTATLTLIATVGASGTLTNTAEVTASDQPDPDSTPNHNVAAEDDQASASVQPAASTGSISGTKFEDLNGDTIRNRGIISGTQPDVVFVIDISGSTSGDFQGTPVGDLNNDGSADTVLDAEIAGFIALNRSLIDGGFGTIADVAIVTFSTNAGRLDMNPAATGLQISTNPSTDADGNGVSDVEDVLRSLNPAGLTNFEAALRESIDILNALGTTMENGNVVFLSDGAPTTGGSHDDEAATLRGRINNLNAFGVGLGSSLPALQIIDPNAVRFTTTDELLDVFSGIGGGGQQRFTEPGIEGVVVFIDSNNNGVLDTDAMNNPTEPFTTTRADDPATTDVNEAGTYTLTNLPPGTHTVCEVIPAGFSQTAPGGSTQCHTVQVGSGAAVSDIQFGNRRLTGNLNSIAGFVYVDANNNGSKDPGEIPLPNVPVTITGPVTRTVMTATDGSYSFSDLPSGTYVVAETQPAAFLDGQDTQGTPLLGRLENDRFLDLNFTGGTNAVNYNLGERGLAPPLVSKVLLLASTPSAHQLVFRFMAASPGAGSPGTGSPGPGGPAAEGEFAVFTAPSAGMLTIRAAATAAPMPPVEVYDAARFPLAISHTGAGIRVPVLAQQSYVLLAPAGKSSALEISFDAALPETNPVNPLDANHDGAVSPLDALAVINWLNDSNRSASRQAEMVLDANGDGHVSPQDALVIVNYLNLQNASGEGTAMAATADAAFADPRNVSWFALHALARRERDQLLATDPDDDGREWIEAIDALFGGER